METLDKECKNCKHERQKRILVAKTESDWRFNSEKFETAPAVFPNNDIIYEVNKLRAHAYATKRNIGVMYCPAKDTPTVDALRERPDLPSQKVSWLNRHDRESGDLYGILPLMKGLPVAMTDHIDRSSDKRILRGTVGTVHSWVLADDESSVFENGKRILKKLPKVVYVLFTVDDGKTPCKWKLPGIDKPGVYPIVPVRREWYLDRGRKYPVLRIRRRQLPLTPAFAMTAHAAQGQTFRRGVIVDLNIGGNSSTMSSYVALTRVEKREDLLIYRPFPLDLFNRGQTSSMGILLSVLKGECIDWQAIEYAYMPSKVCPQCGIMKKFQAFSVTEWKRVDKNNNQLGNCMMCIAKHKAEHCPCQCTTCFRWRAETALPEGKRHWQSRHNRVCVDCLDKRECKVCKIEKPEFMFTENEWKHAAWACSAQGRCKECFKRRHRRPKNTWACSGCCNAGLSLVYFSEWLKTRKTQKYVAGARCISCIAKLRQEEDAQQRKSASMVVSSSESALRLTALDNTASQSASVTAQAATGKHYSETARDVGLQVHDANQKRMQDRNQEVVQDASCPRVTIYCPDCSLAKGYRHGQFLANGW